MDPEKRQSRLRRAWLLNGFLIAVFGISTAIPVHLKLLPPAVKSRLPFAVGDFIGKEDDDTSSEEAILASDTAIKKSNYRNSVGHLIQVSLVISGQDLNNSIHRPERCLRAQGHENIVRDTFALEFGEASTLPVAHLTSTKKFEIEDQIIEVDSHSYYWFVGHKELTNSHYKRSFIDIRDRLTGGTAQRWAYISISTSTLSPTESEADRAIIENFIKELATKMSKIP